VLCRDSFATGRPELPSPATIAATASCAGSGIANIPRQDADLPSAWQHPSLTRPAAATNNVAGAKCSSLGPGDVAIIARAVGWACISPGRPCRLSLATLREAWDSPTSATPSCTMGVCAPHAFRLCSNINDATGTFAKGHCCYAAAPVTPSRANLGAITCAFTPAAGAAASQGLSITASPGRIRNAGVPIKTVAAGDQRHCHKGHGRG